MTPTQLLSRQLAENFVMQKELLLKRSKSKRGLNRDRLLEFTLPKMDRLADIVVGWDFTPDILMAAVFSWARKNRHPDGPMVNMLYSVKYLSKALGHYLDVPYEIIMEKQSISVFISSLDESFGRFKLEMSLLQRRDLSMLTSYPIEFRYVLALHLLRLTDAFFMAPELLNAMSSDRRVSAWMNHRGITYGQVAEFFNKRK